MTPCVLVRICRRSSYALANYLSLVHMNDIGRTLIMLYLRALIRDSCLSGACYGTQEIFQGGGLWHWLCWLCADNAPFSSSSPGTTPCTNDCNISFYCYLLVCPGQPVTFPGALVSPPYHTRVKSRQIFKTSTRIALYDLWNINWCHFFAIFIYDFFPSHSFFFRISHSFFTFDPATLTF